MKPLISVIVPVYNSGQYLDRCIESILRQDYHPIEIIIVDDGSSDNATPSICDEFVNKSDMIHVYHKDNGGSASARNFGLKKARGSYIGFVDSDDIVDPHMFSTLYDDLVTHGVRISIVNIVTEENGHLIDRRKTISSGEYYHAELLHYFFLGCWHSACTNLYDRVLFETTTFPEGEVNEDYMLNYWLFKNQDKIYYNDTVFYHYLRRNDSNTSSPVTLSFLDWLKHTSLIRQDYQNCQILKEEADYQYIYSNIILGNKCLLTLGKEPSNDAELLYSIVTTNLKKERKCVFKNRFLKRKYLFFGILLSCIPRLYKLITVPLLRVKGS